MKKKIALVRGHHLSKEETISYEPLAQDFDFTCFSTNNPWFDHSEIQFPIVTLPSTEGLFRFLPGGIHNRFFGYIDMHLGVGQWMWGLDRHLRGFDLVHVSDYCHFFSYQAAKSKKKLGYKLVAIHYENIPFARDKKPIVPLLKAAVYENADAMFAMSERAKAVLILEGYDPKKIFVIGNAVDVDKFKPREEERRVWRDRFGVRSDDVVILFVGRVRASKGVFELIYATKKLLSDPNVDTSKLRVVIAGRGPCEQDVRDRIAELGLSSNVMLIGSVPHSQIHLLHNVSDIFTLPSVPRKYWQEQFGIVLIESMACGKAIVSTLSGSIPEVVGDAGVLVQPNDHVALYEGLKPLVVNEVHRRQYGMKARERVEQHFSTAVIASKIRDAYRYVLQS